MTLARILLQSCVLVAGLNSACTFYTACPDNRTNNPSGTGGSSGGGGTSNPDGTGGTDISFGGEAPRGKWVNETFNLTDLQSECGNVTYLSAKPGEDRLIVSIAQHGLLAKASGGSEWVPLGQGKNSAVITNRGSTIVYDPTNANVFWEAGIYNGGGVYRTDDGGDTFVDLGLRHDDYVSVDFNDPERKTLLASGHEAPGLLHYSVDGGATWSDIGASFPKEVHICSWPVVLDASTFLLGCGTYGGGAGGIFRSADAGNSWQRVSEHKIFPGPLLASNGSQYWSGEVNEGIVRTDDQGQTFHGPFGKGELTEATPVELPDGRIAALGQRRIVVSSDKGTTWQIVTTDLPFQPNGIVYSPQGRAFYAHHWTCEAKIPSDAVMSYAFDYQAK
jgi:hypothetical protein